MNLSNSPSRPVMKIASLSLPVIGAASLLSLALAGCVVAPAQPYYGGAPAQPYYGGAPVMVAPPPPQVEVVGVSPVAGYIWIGGFWNWVGGRHVWVGGHWEAPRPGQRWVPHQWVREGGGWRLHEGHWDRR
jgi:hypothetical protein